MRHSVSFAVPLIAAAAGMLAAQTNQPPIDNDQVRVIIAHEKPHVKTPLHEHKFNRVMVYLQAGRQDITPQNGPKTVLNFRAGEVKWSPMSGMHTAEVVSNAPVTIVELECKKPGNGKTVEARLDPLKVDPQDYKLEFENDQVRVIRVHMAAHRQVPMHEHTLNRVVIYLTPQNGRMTSPDGKVETAQHQAGEVSWGGPVTHKEENLMDSPFEAIMVEFKS
jgi:phage host-nuclease inhibitor protein Gam